MATRQTTPFPVEAALLHEPEPSASAIAQYLPGEPRIACSDRKGVNTFLQRELATPLLDDIYPWFQGLAPKKGNNISSLHRQRLKGREIIPSEDPKLHMVWNKRKIYIKPIPACLLSHHVWETFLSCPELPGPVEPILARDPGHAEHVPTIEQGEPVEPKHSAELTALPYHQPYQAPRPPTSSSLPSNGPPAEDYDINDSDSEHLPSPSPPGPSLPETSPPQTHPPSQIFDRKIALGFLRSYAYLIRHPSDLKIAREVGLIPDLESLSSPQITFTKWALFISHFQSLPDSAVSKRYHFGHLRLGRLDWAVRMRFLHHILTGILPNKKGTTPGKTKINQKWYYLQPYWSIPVLLEGLLTYFLFAFATASLVLSAMQVSLAVPPGAYIGFSESGAGGDGEIPGGSYTLGLWRFFWVFSNATIYVSAVMCTGMVFALVFPYFRKLVSVILGGLRRGGRGKEESIGDCGRVGN